MGCHRQASFDALAQSLRRMGGAESMTSEQIVVAFGVRIAGI
jgi:hypothetical protein